MLNEALWTIWDFDESEGAELFNTNFHSFKIWSLHDLDYALGVLK